MPTRLVTWVAFGFVCCGEAFGGSAFANRADVVRILRDQSFRIVRQVDKLPRQDLIAAKVIESGHRLRSFLANPGEHYQTFDGWIDETKAYRQLIVAGTSSSYVIICFLRQPTAARRVSSCSLNGVERSRELCFTLCLTKRYEACRTSNELCVTIKSRK